MGAAQDSPVPHNKEAQSSSSSNHQEELKSLSMNFKKKMKIKDQDVGEYSFEPLCLSKLPTSPRSYGQPSTSRHQETQPIINFDSKFIQMGTLAEESKETGYTRMRKKSELVP